MRWILDRNSTILNFLSKYKNKLIIIISGESMLPYLSDGQKVVCDTTFDNYCIGDIVLFTRAGAIDADTMLTIHRILGQNISACTEYDSEKSIKAIKEIGFYDRYEKFEKGLETALYKRFDNDGVEISGGEAQKIAMARAIYKDSPIMILDEPTASLDPISEFEIYKNFSEISKGKTTLFISHRLSSCRFCDEIIVLDKGSIVQQDTHDDLLKNEEGKYYNLWNAQAKYYI